MTSYAIEIELSGVGGGWTDVSSDVRAEPPVQVQYGIHAGGPSDRMAPPGDMRFHLDNSTHNSGAKVGYYSPGNSNVRSGFALGIRVRLKINSIVRFVGWLDAITPTPGLSGMLDVECIASDWMSHAARYPITGLPTLVTTTSVGGTTVTAGSVVSAVLAAVPVQPVASSIATGSDTYAYALDSARQEVSTAATEISRAVNSEYGLAYVKGDGTFTFEARSTRNTATPVFSIGDSSLFTAVAPYQRDYIKNDVRVTVYPRSKDGSSVVLFTATEKPSLAANGGKISFVAPYTDPNQRASRVGGTSMLASSSGTDYTANTASDGSGADLTSKLTVGTSFGGDSATVTLTNTATSAAVFVTAFQIRGQGLYTYSAVTVESKSTSSIDSYGLNDITLDMPYQTSSVFGDAVASTILTTWKNPGISDASITFCASASTALMDAATTYDISTAISVMETVTGSAAYWINGVEMRVEAGGILWVTWYLGRADLTKYWVLDDVSFLLGTNTVLAAF